MECYSSFPTQPLNANDYLPGPCKSLQPDHDGQRFSKPRQVSRTLRRQRSRYARPPVPGMPCHLVSQSEHHVGYRQLHLSSSQDVSTTDTTPQECWRPSQPSLDQKVTLWKEFEINGALLPSHFQWKQFWILTPTQNPILCCADSRLTFCTWQ